MKLSRFFLFLTLTASLGAGWVFSSCRSHIKTTQESGEFHATIGRLSNMSIFDTTYIFGYPTFNQCGMESLKISHESERQSGVAICASAQASPPSHLSDQPRIAVVRHTHVSQVDTAAMNQTVEKAHWEQATPRILEPSITFSQILKLICVALICAWVLRRLKV